MYKILFKESARKEFYSLPQKALIKISGVIDNLQQNPRPAGVKKLKGQSHPLYRIRIGDYRIVYSIDDSVHIVNITRVGHRKDIYD